MNALGTVQGVLGTTISFVALLHIAIGLSLNGFAVPLACGFSGRLLVVLRPLVDPILNQPQFIFREGFRGGRAFLPPRERHGIAERRRRT